MRPSPARPPVRAVATLVVASALLVTLAACVPGARRPVVAPEARAGAAQAAEVQGLSTAAINELRARMRPLGPDGRGADRPLVDPGRGDCAATAFSLPGQEFRIAGGGGPFATAGGPGTDVPGALAATPGQSAVRLRRLPGFALPIRSVGLVVLDDFGDSASNGYRLDASAVRAQLQATLDGLPADADAAARAVALARAAAVLQSAGSLSHGALVLEHTLALLRSLGGTPRPADAKNGIYAFGFGQGEIIVRAVDLGGPLASLAEVARRARQAVSSLSDVAVATVVNMSFAAVPCDIGDDFAANRATYPTFRDYAAAVAGLPSNLSALESTFGRSLDGTDATALTRAVLLRPVSGSELQDALDARQGEVRFVASSGNYGLPYALVPAAWPQVLGVASRDVARNPLDLASLSSFSDAGEVMVGGAYFTLRGLLDPLARVELPALVYAGTSFAAPATSVAVAFDLGQAAPRCGLDATGLPMLRGPDDDTPLETAVADRCAP